MIIRRAMATAAKRVPIPAKGVDYRGKVVLAPMVRSGECPSRLLALKYGADLVWGPETVDRALIGCTRHVNPRTGTIDFTRIPSNQLRQADPSADISETVIFRLHPELEGKRLIFQIGSANPETAVQAAKLVAGDVVGIDLNSGCPKSFSTDGGMGAALLRVPDKLCSILTALVKEVGEPHDLGISVKIRLLETPELTGQLVRRLVQTGITGLTIHCRTTPMRPRERAIREQLRMIGDICREAGVACLMNGDVASRAEAITLAEEFGVDGAMIATAAETNPSVFRTSEDGGKADWSTVVEEYVGLCMQVENRFRNTKYLLGQMMPGKNPKYQMMQRCQSYTDLVNVLGWADQYGDLATKADEVLEIGAFEKPKLTKAEKKRLAAVAGAGQQQQQQQQKKPQQKQQQSNSPIDRRPAKSPTRQGQKRSADLAALDVSHTRPAPGLSAAAAMQS